MQDLKSFVTQSAVGVTSQALTLSLSDLKAVLSVHLHSNRSFLWRRISLLLPLCDTKADASLRKLLPFRKLFLMDRLSSLQSNSSEHKGKKAEWQTPLITLWLIHRRLKMALYLDAHYSAVLDVWNRNGFLNVLAFV